MFLLKWKRKTCFLILILGSVFTQSLLAVTFSSSDYAVGYSQFAITSGDFNNDGALDLAASSQAGVVAVLLNKNDLSGAFNPFASYSVGSGSRSITNKDLNNDGAIDLVTANFFDNSVSVLLNKNDLSGTFATKINYPASSGPSSVTSADFNGDGANDVAVSNRESNSVSVFLNINNFSGTLDTKFDYPVGLSPYQIISSDINGDGAADLVVVSSESDLVSVLINKNNLSGTFNTRVDYATGDTPISTVSNDFNGDGALDIAVGINATSTVSVFLNKNDLTGALNTAVDYIVGGNPYSIISEDFDGDGTVDLATLSSQGNLLSVLLNKNDMSGTFNTGTDIIAGQTPVSVTGGDFNGDGDVDLAVANLISSSFATVLLNTTGREPDAFGFLDGFDVERSTLISSDIITITGLDFGVPINVTGGEYSINGGTFTSSPGTVFSNDLLQVRATSSADYDAVTDVVVTIATVNGVFSMRTISGTVPDDFSFIDQIDVAPSVLIVSNSVTITGLEIPSMISVTGGEYSINNSAFTAADGLINNGDTVVLRHTSSPSAKVRANTVLTIGGVSDTFSTTTSSVNVASVPVSFSDGGGGSFNLVLLFGMLFLICGPRIKS